MALVFSLVVGGLLLGNLWFGWHYREQIQAAWREPVLRYPVLILEADDWGPDNRDDVADIEALSQLLAAFSDTTGRHPVMTLGMLLAHPDRRAMAVDNSAGYKRETLLAERFQPMLESLRHGIRLRVFYPQLHGMEHFWPASVQEHAGQNPDIANWLADDAEPSHTKLPPWLQSRWAASEELSVQDVGVAVEEETALFEGLFGQGPVVVVPPTFVWTTAVEAAWRKRGVEVLITPGSRHNGRDSAGALTTDVPLIVNGDRADNGLLYLVRDVYFEPAGGRRVEQAMAAIESRFLQNRPALVETHAWNYVGDSGAAARRQLGELLETMIRHWPSIRFINPYELAQHLDSRNPNWVDDAWRSRLGACLRRLWAIPGLPKRAWISGAVLPVAFSYVMARTSGSSMQAGGCHG